MENFNTFDRRQASYPGMEITLALTQFKHVAENGNPPAGPSQSILPGVGTGQNFKSRLQRYRACVERVVNDGQHLIFAAAEDNFVACSTASRWQPGTQVDRSQDRITAHRGDCRQYPERIFREMLVPKSRMEEAASIAKAAAEQVRVGDPQSRDTTIGPVVSSVQFEKIQNLIQKGIDEGATLETGGPGRPDGLNQGYYVKPTVFSNVTNDMTIAQDEIFGPVLSLIGYEDDEDAVRIANDTIYGLSGYISSGDPDRAKAIARRIRTGNVHLNGAMVDNKAPFGGYKQSGNGREWGQYGFEEFLEVKAVMGYNAAG